MVWHRVSLEACIMETTLLIFGGLLLLVALERIVELGISKRNAAAIFEKGGTEHGQGHFPVMVFLHTALSHSPHVS